ncbi:MAG: DUF3833 domain-containing protein [Alphaproteobacteria bacterium]|nr:DUF3833 domain-containing protein [Alphaproteobacteria bacterium]
MKKICAAVTGVAFLLSGCDGATTEDYANQKPKMDIREYFNGPIEAWGVLYTFTGKADLQFYATMQGSWDGNSGTLKEHFTYSDGRVDERTWKITIIDDHHFTATAGDVVGVAKGSQHGNTVNMKYVLDAKRSSGGSIKLTMDDWMYRVDDKMIINRIKMKKFGLAVSELVVTMRKK